MTSGSSTRVSAPSSPNRQSSTRSAASEKSEKFVPAPSNVAPSGYGAPGWILIRTPLQERDCTRGGWSKRSAQLEPPTLLPWEAVELDSLPDLVASKMVALVERGAPRDFLDIYTLCRAGLTSAQDCWRLWGERQRRAGSDTDPHRARLAVETHLARIAEHRPLAAIPEPEQRAEAERVRTWFATELLDALSD